MNAAVVPISEARHRRIYGKPFVAVFVREILLRADASGLTPAAWRVMNLMIARMEYGQRVPLSGATIARRLGLARQTVYQALKHLQAIEVLYKHKTRAEAPYDWYISAHIAYRGKLQARTRLLQWEDMIKQASVRGESLNVELAVEHAYAGGVPDDDELPTLPDWLEDA